MSMKNGVCEGEKQGGSDCNSGLSMPVSSLVATISQLKAAGHRVYCPIPEEIPPVECLADAVRTLPGVNS